MHALITGRSGSGKSTICRELVALNQPAFDGDQIPGLANWVDATSGNITKVDYSQPINKTRTEWRWNALVLKTFLRQHNPVFLCGSADNDLTFFNMFDHVFVLDVPPEIQRTRIINRNEHNYGKLPEMQAQIIQEQQELVALGRKLGAIIVNATPAPATIAQTILEYCQ